MALNTLFGQNEEKQVISSPTIFFDDKMMNNMVEGDSGISSLDEGLTLNVKIQDVDSVSASSDGNDMLPNFLGKPFQAVVGSQNKWNPFRKKSGLLGVMHAQTKKNRVVSKHGRVNTVKKSDEVQEHHRLLKDFFTSMVDLSWSWTLFSFAASFYISWLIFAVVWYMVVLLHGDLAEDKPDNHKVCVENIVDFTSCFLYSLETQHTIGYGGRATTEECPMAVIVMSVQSIVGVVIQACMAGIVFAKFTKPTGRAETLMFSKNALITLRNGSLFLLVRLADIRPTHLIGCHVSGHFLNKETTEEGETIPYHLASMRFGSDLDGNCDQIQPFWPLVLSHKIDKFSPLWDLSPRDIQARQFEIILTIEGCTPETGTTVQARTSYLPTEVLWGQQFEHSTVEYDKDLAKYAIRLSAINSIVPDRTPRCSAREMEERKARRSGNISKSASSSSLLTVPI